MRPFPKAWLCGVDFNAAQQHISDRVGRVGRERLQFCD